MKVLILSDQQDVLASFKRQLSLRLEPFDVQAVDARAQTSATQLERTLLDINPDVLIVALVPSADEDAAVFSHYQLLIKAAKKVASLKQVPLIFISSTAVFDGSRMVYQECDEPSPANAYGRWFVEQEAVIAEYAKHMIIRSGWLYASGENNFLAAVIQHAAKDDLISINSAAKSCPTAVDDLVRVVLAILLQMDLQAENWGVFHYVASDTALGFQFMEAVLAQASQFDAAINPKQLRFEHNANPEAAFYFAPVVLKCHRLLEDFGIHQRPWRSLLHVVVKDYYQQIKDNKKGP